MLVRNQMMLLNSDAFCARPAAVACPCHSRVVVITNLFVTPTWRTGEQRGKE